MLVDFLESEVLPKYFGVCVFCVQNDVFRSCFEHEALHGERSDSDVAVVFVDFKEVNRECVAEHFVNAHCFEEIA